MLGYSDVNVNTKKSIANMNLIFIVGKCCPPIAIVTKRVVISIYSYNNICNEYIVDMLLPLNTIDEFLYN
jgi:hypothetical protein